MKNREFKNDLVMSEFFRGDWNCEKGLQRSSKNGNPIHGEINKRQYIYDEISAP